MKRLLLLTPGFAADSDDHNCIPALQLLVNAWLNSGVIVQIIALEYPYREDPYDWQGAQVFPCNGQNNRLLKWRTLWRARALCRQLVQKHTPDALFSAWLGWAAAIGERQALQTGIPHFTILMGQDVLPGNRLHWRNLSPERCQRLVAVSATQNEIFFNNTGFNAGHIIPWGMNEEEIPVVNPARKALDVLGVGSLIPVKNWDKWLETIVLVARQKSDLRAEIAGDGPLLSALKNKAMTLGLKDKVTFSGGLPRREVLQKMGTARVLLHTAEYESFGMVLAEAAMNACYVVSTPVGIAPELGAFCARSPHSLADKLFEALRLPVLTAPVVPFTQSEMAARYLRLLNDVPPAAYSQRRPE